MDFYHLLRIWVKNLLIVQQKQKSTTDATKTVSKRAIYKTAKASGDLIYNEIADKITETSSKETNNEIPKERYIYISKRKTANY